MSDFMGECILYSTGCPKCRVLEKKLDKAGITYELITNEKDILEICNLTGLDLFVYR